MKKSISFLISFILCLSAKSQLNKTTWLAGGAGSFYSYTEDYNTSGYSETSKYTNIDVSASIGYFLADKFATGLRPSFSSTKGEAIRTSIGSGGSTNSYRLGIGPFVRYYFLKSDQQFNILADVSYQFGFYQRLGSLHSKGKNNTFSLMGGSEIFFNETAGVEILLGYAQKILSIDNAQDGFDSKQKGFQASVGFTLHLRKL